MPYYNSPYMDYGCYYSRPPMYRSYDRFEYALGNIVGSFLGNCFANYWGPVSTALTDVSRYKGYKAAEKIYDYYGLA